MRERAIHALLFGGIQPEALMAAKLAKQIAAMDSLAWRITYEWNQAKDRYFATDRMRSAFKHGILESAQFQCLSDKRKETIRFLWYHTGRAIQAQNQVYGWWYRGRFYGCFTELPESFRYDDAKLAKLPCGHFWRDAAGNATTVRYFIPVDRETLEDVAHFLASEPSLPIVNKL